jgi:hypothetical protein
MEDFTSGEPNEARRAISSGFTNFGFMVDVTL